MLDRIGYKICSLFADVYERKRTDHRITDHRVVPAQNHLEHTTEEWFKNGVSINRQGPHDTREIHRVITTDRTWDTLRVEERTREENYSVHIAFKIKNIILTSPFAFYLIFQGVRIYADALN